MSDKPQTLDFGSLVEAIRQVHDQCAAQAARAVNISLTMRNWAIGHYIREYEQNGADRAEYGHRLLDTLARALQGTLDKCYTGRYLGLCRQFYEAYPEIRKSLISRFPVLEKGDSAGSDLPAAAGTGVLTGSGTTSLRSAVSGEKLVERLSFTHIVELVKLDDPLKRAFYEIECLRGNWSVRALKRQIASLYYERSGLSNDKDKLAELTQSGSEQAEPRLAIRDPYVFEFLGIKPKEVMGESDLEDALLDNQLFVSKYQLELPRKQDIQDFLEQKLREVGEATHGEPRAKPEGVHNDEPGCH